MSQIGQLKREIRGAKTLHLSWRIRLLIFVVAAPMTFLLALYGRLELALPSINVIGVLGLTQMEAEGPGMVLDHHDGHCSSSCSVDSSCAVE